jgi:hypothetical protein
MLALSLLAPALVGLRTLTAADIRMILLEKLKACRMDAAA